MKGNELIKYKWKLFLKIILSITAGGLVWLLFLFFVEVGFAEIVAEIVSGFSRPLYYFLTQYKEVFLIATLCMTLLAAIYLALGGILRPITMIVDSIDRVFEKDKKLVELPADFKGVENKLNTIKYEMMRNEQLAKEAEQRKNDLVVYLAHDLKTPLTSVIGYLSLLNEAQDMPAELRQKYLSISLNKAERLEVLINEFFDITRFNLQNIVLEKSRIHLSHMMHQLADEFYPLMSPKNLTCNVHADPNILIEGDADKLARVFDNILRNAINYSYENSSIDVFIEQNAQGVRLRFRNQGIQIPPHKLDKIFEKFYRLDSSRSTETGGSGLGLAIAKQIIELHKGTITASSNEQFTEFTIFLPGRS